ncbi:MAG TPA: hypothetical protein VG324_21000 [Blastocatellia bacterium]|nr:hypothetical protein [Blastocatellia bacterium]
MISSAARIAMYADRRADELENLNNSAIRAPSNSGQHALDAWESEGGGPAGVFGEVDRARTAPTEKVGWRASNNTGWLANHPQRDTPTDGAKDGAAGGLTFALTDDEEDRILRCLGAAVILRWNTIPTKLQKELFENASSMGERLQADALKGQIARFLHKHKDDTG